MQTDVRYRDKFKKIVRKNQFFIDKTITKIGQFNMDRIKKLNEQKP